MSSEGDLGPQPCPPNSSSQMLPVPSSSNADLVGSACSNLLVFSLVFRGLCFPRIYEIASRLHLYPFQSYDQSFGGSPDLPFSTFNSKPLTEASDFPWGHVMSPLPHTLSQSVKETLIFLKFGCFFLPRLLCVPEPPPCSHHTFLSSVSW